MNSRLLLVITVFFVKTTTSCSNNEGKSDSGSDSLEVQELILKEKQSSNVDNSELGVLRSTIDFQVKTDNVADYDKGIRPWISIENPSQDYSSLINSDKIVIPEKTIYIVVDYPLANRHRFKIESSAGFTRKVLISEISKLYNKIYSEEETSATIKTIPVEERTKMYNRNTTNGKYGIWGHDIADLLLTEVLVYITKTNEIVLSLGVDS